MSRTSFRVNPHSLVCLNVNELLAGIRQQKETTRRVGILAIIVKLFEKLLRKQGTMFINHFCRNTNVVFIRVLFRDTAC